MDSTRAQSRGFRTPERWNSVPIPERVSLRAVTNVDKQEDGCWISRYSVGSHGYAQVGWAIPKAERRTTARTQMVLAHRAAWVHVNGQMPLGMTLDHTCKVRRCVNPQHLRMLPNFENARRIYGMDWPMGQCANGHSSALLRQVGGLRNKAGMPREGVGCADCYRVYQARYYWKKRHPGERLPERLLLASERDEAAA